MSLLIDEFGRPIILFDSENTKERIKGVEAFKTNILAATAISRALRSSLGPKGMDKMLISPDGDVLVTNDGATIVSNLKVEHPIAKLLVELSKSQDEETGDGTTGVVVLAGALLEKAMGLLDRGLHPLQIIEGFDNACETAISRLEQIAMKMDINEKHTETLRGEKYQYHENLMKVAQTALCSKVVSKYQKHFAEIAVDAVIGVQDQERKEVNFDLIKVIGKVGGSLEDTYIVQGIVLDKEMSHPQMKKEIDDAKIAILNAAFEPPKPKSKYNVDVKSAEDYKSLYASEQRYFSDYVEKVKASGANFVICQWGFDDEANHLLMHNNLPAVRWVGGGDLEHIALATGGRIVANFNDLNKEKLGKARVVKEVSIGTTGDKMIVLEDCLLSKAQTIVVRGGSSMIVEEAKRCLHDALCVVRNMIKDNKIVHGGGAAEVACSLEVSDKANSSSGIEQYAIRAFAEALDQIPIALAENSGYNGIEYLANLKAKQKKDSNPWLGVDCTRQGTNNMGVQGVYEGLNSKKQQFLLATQVCKMILKIDDVIKPHDLDSPY